MTPRSSQRSKLKKGKSVNSLDYESITESMLNLNRSSLKVSSKGLVGLSICKRWAVTCGQKPSKFSAQKY